MVSSSLLTMVLIVLKYTMMSIGTIVVLCMILYKLNGIWTGYKDSRKPKTLLPYNIGDDVIFLGDIEGKIEEVGEYYVLIGFRNKWGDYKTSHATPEKFIVIDSRLTNMFKEVLSQ